MLDENYWLGINPQIPSLDPPLGSWTRQQSTYTWDLKIIGNIIYMAKRKYFYYDI